jgi:hypothetical protein
VPASSAVRFARDAANASTIAAVARPRHCGRQGTIERQCLLNFLNLISGLAIRSTHNQLHEYQYRYSSLPTLMTVPHKSVMAQSRMMYTIQYLFGIDAMLLVTLRKRLAYLLQHHSHFAIHKGIQLAAP